MATKRTKAEEEQRRSEQLEKKSERRPEQETSNEKVPQDISRRRVLTAAIGLE